jgi:hypothetical protein
MNNKMDWSRFKKLVAMDARGLWPRYGWGMLTMTLLPMIGWGLSIVFGALIGQEITTFPEMRWIGILGVGLLVSIVAPSVMFGTCNVPKKGIYYAMLPASHLEKYLSQVLFCIIVCPLLCIGAGVVVDILLTLLPFGPYKDYIWDCNILSKGLEALNSNGAVDVNLQMNGNGGAVDIDQLPQLEMFRRMAPGMIVSTIVAWLFYASSFMLSNTIFKKFKFLLTVLVYLGVNFVLSLAMPILIAVGLHAWLDDLARLDNDGVWRTYFIIVWTENAINIGLVILMQWLTYRRLKRMRY